MFLYLQTISTTSQLYPPQRVRQQLEVLYGKGDGFDNDGWRRSKEGYRENKRIEKQIELSLAPNFIFNRKRFHLSKHRFHPYS